MCFAFYSECVSLWVYLKARSCPHHRSKPQFSSATSWLVFGFGVTALCSLSVLLVGLMRNLPSQAFCSCVWFSHALRHLTGTILKGVWVDALVLWRGVCCIVTLEKCVLRDLSGLANSKCFQSVFRVWIRASFLPNFRDGVDDVCLFGLLRGRVSWTCTIWLQAVHAQGESCGHFYLFAVWCNKTLKYCWELVCNELCCSVELVRYGESANFETYTVIDEIICDMRLPQPIRLWMWYFQTFSSLIKGEA